MLRITNLGESCSRVTLKLEGALASDWVSVLEAECLACLQERRKVVLDFSNVTFIDENGVKVLRRLAAKNVEVIDHIGLVNDLLKEGKKK